MEYQNWCGGVFLKLFVMQTFYNRAPCYLFCVCLMSWKHTKKCVFLRKCNKCWPKANRAICSVLYVFDRASDVSGSSQKQALGNAAVMGKASAVRQTCTKCGPGSPGAACSQTSGLKCTLCTSEPRVHQGRQDFGLKTVIQQLRSESG